MFLRVCLGVVIAGCLAGARAQSPATQALDARQQADVGAQFESGLVSTSMTSAETFAPGTPADADIGEQILLQPEQRYQPFSAWTNWSTFWTNNASLIEDTNWNGSDTVLTGTVGGSYLPHLGANFFADLSAEQSMFRYARNGSLDFNALRLQAGLIYVWRDLADLTFFGHYSYDLLTARGFNREIYHDHTIDFGARKVFNLSRAHLIYTAASAEFTLGGEPSYALRNEFAWLIGYQATVTRRVRLDLYYRVAAQPYRYGDRADFNQLIGGGLSCEVTRWLSVQATTTLGINRSTDETYNYFAANLGGGVGLMVNF